MLTSQQILNTVHNMDVIVKADDSIYGSDYANIRGSAMRAYWVALSNEQDDSRDESLDKIISAVLTL